MIKSLHSKNRQGNHIKNIKTLIIAMSTTFSYRWQIWRQFVFERAKLQQTCFCLHASHFPLLFPSIY
jgi:hypothetical protein